MPGDLPHVREKSPGIFLFISYLMLSLIHICKELGIRTVFNILGPLSNPAGANMELMGVFDQTLVEPLAQVMAKMCIRDRSHDDKFMECRKEYFV